MTGETDLIAWEDDLGADGEVTLVGTMFELACPVSATGAWSSDWSLLTTHPELQLSKLMTSQGKAGESLR